MTIARSERFLWSFIGLVGGSFACVQTQRTLWRSTSELSDSFLSPPPPSPSSLKSSLGNPSTTTREEEEEEGFVFGKFAKAKAKRIWNESVDFTFKPIVEYLSRKGYWIQWWCTAPRLLFLYLLLLLLLFLLGWGKWQLKKVALCRETLLRVLPFVVATKASVHNDAQRQREYMPLQRPNRIIRRQILSSRTLRLRNNFYQTVRGKSSQTPASPRRKGFKFQPTKPV